MFCSDRNNENEIKKSQVLNLTLSYKMKKCDLMIYEVIHSIFNERFYLFINSAYFKIKQLGREILYV